MRAIKFRAWVKTPLKEEEGLYYPTAILMNGDGSVDKFFTEEFKFTGDICKFILMQYTGLKDKNGKEIYEGDIVQSLNSLNVPFCIDVIEWNDTYAGFNPWAQYTGGKKSFEEWEFKIEVIGNIYENSNLLNENKR